MVSARLRAQALPPKKKKKAPQAPETADEFLAAGVEEEEGGEKWRAGDIVKSSRFFARALDHYRTGLQKHPQDADLAYNRARLQYDICQQPRLLSAFRSSANTGTQDLLQLALDWHEYALQLKRDDADLIFNVGQLYRDMGEREQEGQNDQGALEYFQRALQAFRLCGDRQNEVLVAQGRDMIPDVPPSQEARDSGMEMEGEEDGGVPVGGERAEAEETEDDRWATVVEPVTPASIYDTVTAALQTTTSMLPLIPSDEPGQPSRVAEYHIIGERLAQRLQELTQAANGIEDWVEQHPQWERELLVANYRAAYQDALARQGKTTPTDYSNTVTALLQTEQPTAQWLADTAEADNNLNATLANISQQTPPGPDLTALANIRWKHLTRALNSLTSLSKLGADATNGINLSISTVHARRAETELLRRRMGEPVNGGLHKDAQKVLAGNAEKFFRGARQLAERDGEDPVDFHAREIISNRLAGGQQGAAGQMTPADLERNLVEMVDEGLLSRTEAEAMAS